MPARKQVHDLLIADIKTLMETRVLHQAVLAAVRVQRAPQAQRAEHQAVLVQQVRHRAVLALRVEHRAVLAQRVIQDHRAVPRVQQAPQAQRAQRVIQDRRAAARAQQALLITPAVTVAAVVNGHRV